MDVRLEDAAWTRIQHGLIKEAVQLLCDEGIQVENFTFLGDAYATNETQFLHLSLILSRKLTVEKTHKNPM